MIRIVVLLLVSAWVAAVPYFVEAEEGKTFEARALIQSEAEVTLSSEIGGRIIEQPHREGEQFRKGDTLIRFDCRVLKGYLRSARGKHQKAMETLSSLRKRAEYDSVGSLDIRIAEAELEIAKGNVSVAAYPVERCRIRAPFDGRVMQLGARRHETVAVGAPLMRVLDDNRLELKIVIPSIWLSWLEHETPFVIRIDETGERFKGKVARIGAVIDARSQTIFGFARLTTRSDKLRAGMSGMATFSPNQRATSAGP